MWKSKNNDIKSTLLKSDHVRERIQVGEDDGQGEITEEDVFAEFQYHIKHNIDNEECLNDLVTKIYSKLTSSDHQTKENVMQEFMNITSIIVEKLKQEHNEASSYYLSIIRACILPKTTRMINRNAARSIRKTVIIHLINLKCAQILTKIILNKNKLPHNVINGKLFENAIWILNEIAPRDVDFMTIIITLNAVSTFHLLLQRYFQNNKMLLPLLKIMKRLSKNALTGQELINDEVAITFEKIFLCLNYNLNLKFRLLLECFQYLTLNETFCNKFVEINMTQRFLHIFNYSDGFNKHVYLKISNSALITLCHLCKFEFGRKSVKSNSGLHFLYHICAKLPDEKKYDHLLLRIQEIFCHCVKSRKLPVPKQPPVEFHILEKFDNSPTEKNDTCNGMDNGASLLNKEGSKLSMEQGRCYKDNQSLLDIQNIDCDLAVDNFSTKVNYLNEIRDSVRYRILWREFEEFKKINQQSVKKQNTSAAELPYPGSELSLNILNKLPHACEGISKEEVYLLIASNIKSVIPFCKVPYPDATIGKCYNGLEPLNIKDRLACRSKLLAYINRSLNDSLYSHKTVYDLDNLIANQTKTEDFKYTLHDIDKHRISTRASNLKHLQFESRFESGNLRKAIQIGSREYELILTSDVNSNSQHQWFYFEVSNMEAHDSYTFHIINCEKSNSQFNFGMKPILYSVIEALHGHVGWVRAGTNICYYRNNYRKPGQDRNNLYTTSFSLVFPHANDICYLAYNFPYTYSRLLASIWEWTQTTDPTMINFRVDTLCHTLNDNDNPVITITAPDFYENPIRKRKLIFLTARVHPGESNASWIMHGTLQSLLNDSAYASYLRNNYIFKIIPMLNVEGVINGCNRYGLTNEDLNRQWRSPKRKLHPEIYYTKGLIEYCDRILLCRPFLFVDYHGHSRRKNVFLFGCSNVDSWNPIDCSQGDYPSQYLMLPYLMQRSSPAFALSLCSFKVEKYKEATARVTIWRQFGVIRSYTLESSFCGCDQGSLADYHLDIQHLQNIGEDFCKALALMENCNTLTEFNTHQEKYCCPMQCICTKSKKPRKCIQDKEAKHHIIGIS